MLYKLPTTYIVVKIALVKIINMPTSVLVCVWYNNDASFCSGGVMIRLIREQCCLWFQYWLYYLSRYQLTWSFYYINRVLKYTLPLVFYHLDEQLWLILYVYMGARELWSIKIRSIIIIIIMIIILTLPSFNRASWLMNDTVLMEKIVFH